MFRGRSRPMALAHTVLLRLDRAMRTFRELPMPIYEFAIQEIRALSKTTFSLAQLQERRDLQRLLRANVSVVAPDTLVIAEDSGIGTSRAGASISLASTEARTS